MRALLKSSCAVDRVCAQLRRDLAHEIRSIGLITCDVSRSKSLSDKIRIPIVRYSSVHFSKRKSASFCFDPFRNDKHAPIVSPIYVMRIKCRYDFAGISSISYYFFSSYICVCVYTHVDKSRRFSVR